MLKKSLKIVAVMVLGCQVVSPRIVPLDPPSFLESIGAPEDGAELLDQIEYVISGTEESVVLTQSDLQRPTIDGRVMTPRQWISMWSTYLDAQRYKLTVDDEDVNKTLLGVQREYGLTEDDLRAMFKQGGYSWEEARRQLGVMQLEKTRIDWEVSSHANDRISDEEIEAFCNAHPVYVTGHYTMQRAVVPYDVKLTKEEQLLLLAEMLENKKEAEVAWSSSYSLEEGDLPDDAQYITELEPGCVCKPRSVSTGFELIKMVDKQVGYYKPYQERRQECEAALRDEAFQEIIQNFYDTVIENTSIVKY